MPPRLRREALRHPAGPDRDAILRLADELEATGNILLVSRATLRAGIAAAFPPEDDYTEPEGEN